MIGFFSWPYIGRIVRGQTISLREREYVEAARSLGATWPYILRTELLPTRVVLPTHLGVLALAGVCAAATSDGHAYVRALIAIYQNPGKDAKKIAEVQGQAVKGAKW